MDKNNPDETLQEIVEHRLLRVKAQLSDGTTGKVFSVIPTERGPRWRCHACNITVTGSREIYRHERSREHAIVMVDKKQFDPANFRPLSPIPAPHQTILESWNLAPGEPVPPGFEGEVRASAEIQKKLDGYTAALIGLEYLFELHNADEKEPHYICILCDKRGDPRTVMAHLISFNHRMKYIESHFPKANIKFNHQRIKKNYKKTVFQNVVNNLATWIEARFGRLTPHACDRESFERKRESYTQTVVKDVHFCDKFGETLEELVNDAAFEKSEEQPVNTVSPAASANQPLPGCLKAAEAKRRSPSPPVVNAPGAGIKKFRKKAEPGPPGTRRGDRSPLSSVSSLSLSDDESPNKKKSESRRRPDFDRRPAPYNRDRVKYRRDYRRSPSPKPRYPSNPRFPWKRPEYAQKEKSDVSNRKRITAETARWEEFRKGVAKIEEELEHVLRNHEKNPEKHPHYPEEWKKFWNRRYKELQAEHKDPSKHDFKPEWVDFWNKRMREMHEQELKSKKDALRKRLNLPEEFPPIKFKIGAKNTPSLEEPISDTEDVIIIEDSKEPSPKRKSSSVERRERKRSHSPWEADYPEIERHRKREYYNRYEKRAMPRYQPPYVYEEPEEEDEAQLNIVAVLRLLTALEEKLGSLGPKVIDMLSTALAMEKAEANSAETLLDNDVHCVLFETVKEKLKGQLLAGMIETNAQRPAKNAVKRIASLLHLTAERKKKAEAERKLLGSKPKPLSVPGVGEVDKEAIAKQITSALLAQGRTNVTQEELEQLIGAVVGMAQAKSTGQEVTTATYAAKIQSDEKVKTSALVSNDSSAMDSLSDSDLKTLLQNFKDLSTDEQHGLISYLKKLEAHDLDRVERLRKFVNLDSKTEDVEKVKDATRSPQRDLVDISPEDFNESRGKINKSPDNSGFVKIDSDEDDDYTYEDVFKAASKNVIEKQESEAKPEVQDPNTVLNDAKLMIANIMGQLGQKNSGAQSRNFDGPSVNQNRNIEPLPSSRLPFLNDNSRPNSSQDNIPLYDPIVDRYDDDRSNGGYSDNYKQPFNNFNNQNQPFQRHFPEPQNKFNSNEPPFNANQYNQSYDHFSIPPQQQFSNHNQQFSNYQQGFGDGMHGSSHPSHQFSLQNNSGFNSQMPSGGFNGSNNQGFNSQMNMGGGGRPPYNNYGGGGNRPFNNRQYY